MKKHFEETLLLVGLLINLYVIIAVENFPYCDIVNHLARYDLMAKYWFGDAPHNIYVELIPTPYIALDIAGALLVWATSPEVAIKLLTSASVILTSVGMYRLIAVTNYQERGWALIGVLMSFNWGFLYGFINFNISVGLALLWLSWWWPRRGLMSKVSIVMGAVGALLIYLVHMIGAAVVVLVLGIDYAVSLFGKTRETKAKPFQYISDNRFFTAVVVLAPMVVVYFMAHPIGSDVAMGQSLELRFRGIGGKVTHLMSDFYSFSIGQGLIMALGYAASAASFLGTRIRQNDFHFDSLTVSVVALLIIYMIFPVSFIGGYYLDVRFLLPLGLLLFCIPSGQKRLYNRYVFLIPFFFCALHASIVYKNASTIDHELSDFKQVMSKLPRNAAVLSLVTSERWERLVPYRHFIHWHVIRNEGFANSLFCFEATASHFKHFHVSNLKYNPDEKLGVKYFGTLDWERITKDYDFIVQAGNEERADRIIRSHADPTCRVGEITLYRVRKT